MNIDNTSEDRAPRIRRLIKDLMGSEAMAREKARLGLVAIGKPAVEYLVELVYAEKDIWRWEAVKALGQIGDPDTIPVLIDALEDENGGIRWLAAEGLSRHGLDVIQPLLRALIRRQKAVFLSQGVHHVLYQIEKKLDPTKDARLDAMIRSFLMAFKTPMSRANMLNEARELVEFFELHHKRKEKATEGA